MSKKNRNKRREEDMRDVANDFSVYVVEDLMKYYQCDFKEVDRIFKKIGYWDILNNDEVACVAASEYRLEELVETIRKLGVK